MNTGPTATTGDIHINPTVVTPVPPQAVASVPRIDSFFPTSGVPGDVVNIFGAGFTDDDGFPAVTTVTFNKISALFTVITDAMILATVQPLATTGPVEVMTPGGRAASLASYVVVPAGATSGPVTVTDRAGQATRRRPSR